MLIPRRLTRSRVRKRFLPGVASSQRAKFPVGDTQNSHPEWLFCPFAICALPLGHWATARWRAAWYAAVSRGCADCFSAMLFSAFLFAGLPTQPGGRIASATADLCHSVRNGKGRGWQPALRRSEVICRRMCRKSGKSFYSWFPRTTPGITMCASFAHIRHQSGSKADKTSAIL